MPVVLVRDELQRKAEETEGSEKNRLEKIVEEMDKIEAQVAVPLPATNGLEGIIALGEKTSGDAYSVSDIRILETLMYQAGTAIENARLYHEVRSFSEKLKSEIDKATKTLVIRNEELSLANKRILEFDRMKKEFIPIAAQEIRIPMVVIQKYLWMLKKGDGQKLSSSQRKSVASIIQNTDKLLEDLSKFCQNINNK